MANTIATLAVLLAAVLAVAAFVALAMEMHVLSGTLFTFTAFAIYIRETRS